MKRLKSILGSDRKSAKPIWVCHADRNRFTKSMPGESAVLASVRLGCMSL